MFAQAGLRFDEEFLNRTFFSSGNVVFRVYTLRRRPAAGLYKPRQWKPLKTTSRR